MEQSLQELRTLLKRIELIIAQHINYVDRLKKSLRSGEAFPHKKCTECAFGKLFYSEIWPNKDQYPLEIASLLETIERLHCDFHQKAFEIESVATQEEKLKILKEVEEYSMSLLNPLLSLRGKLKRLFNEG